HDVGDAALRIQRLGDAGRLLLPSAARHRRLEVEACAEILARALQHDDARVAIALQALEIDVERIDQRRIERVEALGTIERHPVAAVVMLDQQRLGHGALLHPLFEWRLLRPLPLWERACTLSARNSSG